jgi:predicted nucleotidyltransferase
MHNNEDPAAAAGRRAEARFKANAGDILASLVGSASLARVLGVVFDGSAREYCVADVAARTGDGNPAVDAQLRRLQAMRLLVSQMEGHRRFYRANPEHPLYAELCSMVAKSVGLRNVMAEALASPWISVAFIFGSIGRGEDGPLSDVDLMVFGKLADIDLARMLRGVSDRVGREINWHIYSRETAAERLAEPGGFLARVLGTPRVFAVGDEQALAQFLPDRNLPGF